MTMRTLLALLLCLVAAAAVAHKPSDSYLTLERHGAEITGQWDIALRGLDEAIRLDANGDGEITWGEVRAKNSAIAAHALARLEVTSGGAICTLRTADVLIDEHSDGAYAVLRLHGAGPEPGPVLSIDHLLLFDIDPPHRRLLQYVPA